MSRDVATLFTVAQQERLTSALEQLDSLSRAIRTLRDDGYRRKGDLEQLLDIRARAMAGVDGALVEILRAYVTGPTAVLTADTAHDDDTARRDVQE